MEEGVDYTFSYDSTANLITLTPLSGVWDDQSSYRVSLNNRDRSVLVAPSPTQINDGDQLRVTDSDGGTVVFEFESGFQLFLPETLSLTVPSGDGNALRDGDVFQIIDSQGRQLTFEFDRDGFTLSDEIFINTPAVAAPSIPSEFDALVAEFVSDISDAITGSGLAASVAVVGDQIVVEARGGATITSETITGDTDGVVIENGDTLRFDLPDSGGAFDANLRGIDFIMSVPRPNQQTLERTFAFAAGGAASQLGAVPVIGLDAEPETSNPDVLADFRDQIVTRLAAAINASGLSVEASPVVIDGDANGRSDRVAVAAETGARINTASSRLMPNVRTLALRIPEGGTAAGAIEDGNQFTISNGIETVIFEYSFIGGDADGVLNNPNAIPGVLDIADGALSGLEVANATSTALAGSSLRLVPSLSGQNLFLNLPIDGSAEVNSGPIQVVAVARPVQDGDTIQIAQAPEAASPAIEILTSFPTEQPVAISGGLVDGEILTIQNVSGDLIRIELFASEEPREQIGDRRLLDITEVITPENGDSILQIVDAITLARLIAAEIDAAQNDPAGAIDLGYTPVAQDQFVFLDRAGTATAPTVQSGAAGIVLNNEAQFVRRATLEFDSDGETDPDHIAVPFTLSDSADTLSARVVEVLNTDAADQVVGLEAGSQFIVNGPIEIDANADAELTVTVTPNSSLEVRGDPTVTAGSTIQVFGPLVLDMPDLGGFSIINGSVLTVTDDLGNETVFQFILPLSNLPPLAGAIVVDYDSADSAEDLAANLALVINTAGLPGITATVVNEDQVELGRIDRDRVANTGIAAFPGATSITIFRGIVSDGEVITIRQGDIEVSYEFENVDIGDGVAQGNVQVSFQSSNSPGEIAETLASAIQTNLLGLRLSPEATVDESGESDGGVRLGDIAGTQIDVSLAPTLNIEGVPGGANAIRVSAGDTAEAIKQRILDQLARLQGLSTTLVGEDRGGAEFFIENAAIIEGPITNYFLPAIKDLAGNDLSPNRDDLTTQFTFLLPGIGFDFGDAPDPVGSVAGRYPTRLSADGARHVVSDNGPFLGSSIDGEPDALAVITADGDDLTIGVELSPLPDGVRPLFQLADDDLFAGSVAIEIIPPIDGNQAIRARDGDTITITTGIRSAILEVDTDGLFDEDNFAISLPDAQQSDDVPVADIAAALTQAIQEAQAADQLEGNVLPPQMNADGNLIVELSGDDEDGVRFSSERNPVGIFDRGVWTPIDVELSGTGFLEAWIDFNADGDWDDPGELIISGDESLLTQANATIIGLLKPDELETAIFTPADIAAAARFAIAEGESEIRTFFITVPDTAPDTNGDTYARFRVSTSGTGSPTGLALSGEVEDYLVSVTGSMPTQVPQVASGTTRSYSVFEDSLLDAGDEDGTSVSGPIDDGLLVGLVGNGDLQIFDGDVGTRTLTVRGDTIVDGQVEQIPVGELTVNSNGTFQFRPATDFNGPVSFSVRVQDVDTGLVAPSRVTASIDVRPVNDAPERRDDVPGGQVIVNRTIFEDNATSLTDPTILNEGRVILSAETLVIDGETLTGLIDPFFVPGPENESDQTLVFRSVFGAGDLPTSINQSTVTSLGGIVTISGDGRSLIYQPPVDRDTGTGVDSFTYTIEDRDADLNFLSRPSDEFGTVNIQINAVNDPPRLGNDRYDLETGQPSLAIPITTPFTEGGLAPILANDNEEPPNVAGDNQPVRLRPGQFTVILSNGSIQPFRTTSGGGRISQTSDNVLTYTPAIGFSGLDTFTYIVEEVGSPSVTATATVTIDVNGTNNAPEFDGVTGDDPTNNVIALVESKTNDTVQRYNLDAWFTDVDGDDLVYQVTSNNPQFYNADVIANELVLQQRAFAFGNSEITLTVTDGVETINQTIQVQIANVQDAPEVFGSFSSTTFNEDRIGTLDLNQVFRDQDLEFGDPNAQPLEYRIVRVDNLFNPTNEDLASHPIIQSIDSLEAGTNRIVGDVFSVTPQPDQFGDTVIEVSAFDGEFLNSFTFTYTLLPIGDAPRLRLDPLTNQPVTPTFNVPVGGSITIDEPSLGLTRFGFDPDEGSSFEVVPGSITQGNFGVVVAQPDGRFTYTTNDSNPLDLIGQTDTFTYRLRDNTGRLSQPIDVTIVFARSEYQNPVSRFDVTDDRFVTALDALRVINYLNIVDASFIFDPENPDVDQFSVSEIGTPPPDYLDVNGDGRVSSLDALQVINELNRRANGGVTNAVAEPIFDDASVTRSLSVLTDPIDTAVNAHGLMARSSATTAHASAGAANLGVVNVANTQAGTSERDTSSTNPITAIDSILGLGVEIKTVGTAQAAADRLIAVADMTATSESQGESYLGAVDEAIDDLFFDLE
ncbi:MAG: tandem-95 repeat protein [Planctomycetota bacterium]